MENAESVTKKQQSGKKKRPERAGQNKEPQKAADSSNIKSVMGIELNAKTARSAIVMSEIIGPPVSRRRGKR